MALTTKQDSNRTGLAIAEEISLKVLPDSLGGTVGDQAGAIWYAQEPNEYSDFGSDLSLVARSPINASRQNQKGGVVDLDASGGFNTDFTQSNTQRLLQGFFFADAREKQRSNNLRSAANPVANIASNVLTFTNNFATAIPAGALVLTKGFASPANNGLKLGTAGGLKSFTGSGLIDDAAPIGASAEVVGVQFAAAAASLALTAGAATLNVTGGALDTLGLTIGEWIFIGGDTLVNRFESNLGYARIKSITAGSLVFDKFTGSVFTAEAGTGKSIRIFFGTVLRNEKNPDLIKRRSYTLERTLGNDGDGTQAEYLSGSVANELKINVPQADKLNADLSFVSLDNKQRTGKQGLLPGTRVNAPGEGLYNTSSNVYRMKMNIIDPNSVTPTPLFAYITEADITISNGVTPDKAVGVLGAFDTSAGNFVVSGSVSAYFSDVRAVQAVRNNSDVTADFIFAANNAGFIIDLPLLALGGGRLDVASGESIKLPLDMSAAESPNGYTLLMVFFSYLPNVATPS